MDNNEPKTDEKVAKKITSLLDLVNQKPKTVMMEFTYGDELFEFEIELLNNYEWMELDHSIPFPDRVQEGVTAQGKNYDYSHPEYQLALRKRTTLIQLKRIARCIQATIPGDSNDEQAKWLGDNFSFGLLDAIVSGVQELHNEGDATIVHRSKTFQRNGTATTPNNGKITSDT